MAGKYKQLKDQIAKLEKEAAAARKVEAAEAVTAILALMTEFDLTVEDLGFKAARKAVKGKSASAPKYRDPQTGKTWTGRGKPPAWMAVAIHAGTTEALLIEKMAAPAPAPSTRKRKPARKTDIAPATEVPTMTKKRGAKVAVKTATAKPAPRTKAPKRPRKKASGAPPAELAIAPIEGPSEQTATPAEGGVIA